MAIQADAERWLSRDEFRAKIRSVFPDVEGVERLTDKFVEGIFEMLESQAERTRSATIEECAKVAEGYQVVIYPVSSDIANSPTSGRNERYSTAGANSHGRAIARSIRSLNSKQKDEHD